MRELGNPPPGIQASGSQLRRPSCVWIAQRCSAARVRFAAPVGAPLTPARRFAVGARATGGSAGNQMLRGFFVLRKTNNR